ncbi:MAG TPA: hypothetical protein P5560_04365 [Thermotogota bacterium]|nr:hypothetical protein [Thermotogota bacterium]HRW92167.1 hypothetical protein [Thermotogota bacterium]
MSTFRHLVALFSLLSIVVFAFSFTHAYYYQGFETFSPGPLPPASTIRNDDDGTHGNNDFHTAEDAYYPDQDNALKTLRITGKATWQVAENAGSLALLVQTLPRESAGFAFEKMPVYLNDRTEIEYVFFLPGEQWKDGAFCLFSSATPTEFGIPRVQVWLENGTVNVYETPAMSSRSQKVYSETRNLFDRPNRLKVRILREEISISVGGLVSYTGHFSHRFSLPWVTFGALRPDGKTRSFFLDDVLVLHGK